MIHMMQRSFEGVGVAETHSAAVFFFGDRAYKVKKPLDLGFCDFRTRQAREAACHREVLLNRRFAPDVYLGVADITLPDGRVGDHMVVMRRMPPERCLARLVREHAPVADDVRRVAELLATFHMAGPRSPAADEAATADSGRTRWTTNTEALRALGDIFDTCVVERVQVLAERYLDGRTPLFDDRIATGRAVDGHGDLLSEDIYCLLDGPRLLDCIEFDDALRLGDGLADAAFLAMDLERLGAPDLGAAFLETYRVLAADHWPASLAHHHIAYRAQVRAKVLALRSTQGKADAAIDAAAHLGLALQHLEAGRVRLVLIGGLPGTGKSTIAVAVARELDATLLRSDELRKESCVVARDRHAPARYGEGMYALAATEGIYATMLDRATIALSMGETVVLDASWARAAWRDQARLVALAMSADIVEVRCHAPTAVAAERMLLRSTGGADASDATPAIAAKMVAAQHPWPEAVALNTAQRSDVVVRAALRIVGARHMGPIPAMATSRSS